MTYPLSRKAWLVTALFVFFHITALCVDLPEDSVRRLQEVVVRDRTSTHAARIDSAGTVSLSAAALRHGPRTLGEADALHTLTSLPGYTAAGDYGSGVSVGSDDLSTTLYTIDGATVFHPFHFGGIFSGFNASHLASVRVDRIRRDYGEPMHSGAHIRGLSSDYVPSAISGIVNIGMLATGATVAVPVHGSSALRLSARTSHINSLYGSLLDDGDTSIRYGFEDANLTFLHSIDSLNSLKLSAYANSDRLRYFDGEMTMATRLRWSNISAIASWRHQGKKAVWHQDVTYTQYYSDMHTAIATVMLDLESGVRQIAATASAAVPALSAGFGYRLEYTRFQPQRPTLTDYGQPTASVDAVDSWLAAVSGGKEWRIGALTLSAQADAAIFRSCGSSSYALDPSVALSGYAHGNWTLRAGCASQFVHLVGLSDMGFATDFRLPSARGLAPERSFGLDFIHRLQFLPWFDLTVNAFAKRVLNSPQYVGGVLDIIYDTYDPFVDVTLTDGYNAGGDVLAAFSAGPVSGWAGYGLALCRRKAAGRWTSSAREPLHSLKAMVECSIGTALKLSASFVLASGRPYTPVMAIYIIGGNVLTEYGLLNSARLPAYHRLDLSATYSFPAIRSRGLHLRHYSNLSMINAYGHRNVEMQYFSYNASDRTISLRRICSLYRFLPSISYTIEF